MNLKCFILFELDFDAMKKISKPLAFFGLLFLLFSLTSGMPAAKDTIIYIVRHAEKETNDAKNNDPDLSTEGRERAEALNNVLAKDKLSAVYSTKYKRTTQTAAPVAQRNGVPVKTYEANNPAAIAQMIKEQFPNKKVLIVGHSNTILELVKAFGVTPPVDKLNDDDYDLLFKIIIDKKGSTTLSVQRFGKLHHSTELSLIKSPNHTH